MTKRFIREALIGMLLLFIYVGLDGFAVPFLLNQRDFISPILGAIILLASVVAMPILSRVIYNYYKTNYFSNKENK